MSSEGARRRDAGIETVLSNNAGWASQAVAMLPGALAQVPPHFVGEDLRAVLLEAGLPEPRHPNAWGGLINTAVRKGWMMPTGAHRPMRLPRSHARQTPVYRVEGLW